ncbi:serine threonine kinase 11-interacting protein [Lasius niger]|uniref:Serine threonine kinase 11-interacting protein n=1 Tax=Lasius niger TaxID=67767 RepID=A0A0J7KRA1_LASNI|nr:serine threonine kinase 11-interacting protein [Lasius niger]
MSNSQDTVNMEEIIQLVKLLRQNGDKILSAASKLSLSTKLLHSLNQAFSLIALESEDLDSSFRVCNSSKIDIFRDIKFLHDFVQKTISLKVTHCSPDVKIIIDISKFRHLRYLELKKVSIELLKGLQSVRGQLESIVCAGRKGVSTIYQLLATCGGDAGIGFVWASLRHLVLPHNALECLDESLELAPWLQILDLNHNMITNAKEISCLSNLKYVNLGYNKLEEVPVFNKAALHSLQILVLKNNYIDNLNEKNVTKNKKKPNMKEAIIDEIDQEKGEFKKLPDVVASSHLESSKDHLETKKRILDLREKFGENNWLSSHAGTSVQDIMGLRFEQFPTSQVFDKTLADINIASSVDDNLICTMYNEKLSNEPESQEIAECTEDDKSIPQNEEILDKIYTPETHMAHSMIYDPSEGESCTK